MKKNLLYFLAIISCQVALAQTNSMGVGTNTPNPNAVLELVSPTNDQGLLVPRLTSAERTAMTLSNTENGLMVFDTDQGLFYFWVDPNWVEVSNGANGDMLASVYDPDENGSVTAADSVSVNFFDGTSIQYDLLSGTVGVRGGGISTTKLANSAVTTTKLADGSITTAKLSSGAVTTTEILDGTIGSADLANSSVTGNKIANSTVTATKLGTAAVQTGAIEDGAVTSSKIGITGTNGQVLKHNGVGWFASAEDNTVLVDGTTITGNGSGTQLSVGTLATSNLGDGTVTSAKIFDGTVGTADLANASVTSTKIGTAAVQTVAIEDGAVTSPKIGITATTGDVLSFDGTTWSGKANVSSQWTTNGANIGYVTGSVGAGTTSPADRLHAHETGSSISRLRVSHATSGFTATDGAVLEMNGTNAYLRNYESGSTILGTNGSYTTISSAGNMSVSGSVSATSFSGNGSGLTNLPGNFNTNVNISGNLLSAGAVTHNGVIAIDKSYEITQSDYALELIGAGNFTLVLPPAAENTGRELFFVVTAFEARYAITLQDGDEFARTNGVISTTPLPMSLYVYNDWYMLKLVALGNRWYVMSYLLNGAA